MPPTQFHPDLRIAARFALAERICLVATASIGLVMAVLWFTGVGVRADWHIMRVNTALSLLLAAAAGWLSREGASQNEQRASYVMWSVLGFLALLTLLEFISGANFGIDTLLVADLETPYPGRMSLQTAWGLLLFALLLPWSQAREGVRSILADLLTLVLAGFVLVLLDVYVFGSVHLYGQTLHMRLSPETLLCLLLLATVAVTRRVRAGGVLSVIGSEGIGSRIARGLLLPAILLPPLLSLLRGYATDIGLLTALYAGAIVVSSIIFLVCAMILLTTWHINRLELELRDALARQSQAQLRESKQRYDELVEQANEGILVRRDDGRLLFVNETFSRMLGYSRDELLDMSIRDVVYGEDVDTIERVQQLATGEGMRVNKRMRRKDGQLLHVEVSARRLPDGNIQSLVLDVSQSRLAEERFRKAVEGSPNAMLMVGEDGRIVLTNPQAERLFGYSYSELIGATIEMLVPDEVRGRHGALRAGYHRNPQMRGMGMGRELYGRRKDGSLVRVEIGLNPINTEEGRFALASVIDITDRELAKAREREYMEELRLLSQRLLEAQETERRDMARELHDEIGQALTATGINLRQLEAQAGDGPLSGPLAATSAIIADLLKQVRQISLDLHPSMLDDLGLAAALRWLVRTRAMQLQPELQLEESIPRLDPVIEHTAFRVVQEATSNILKHAQATRLWLGMQRRDGQLVLEIRDDGKGFDPEAAHKHALRGSSLGVVGMQERVRLAGGSIVIESSPGRGTRVRVSLPFTEKADGPVRGRSSAR